LIYFLKLEKIQTTEGYEWIASFYEYDSIVGGGKTPEEAIAEAKENLMFYLEYLQEDLPSKSKNNLM